MPLAPVERFAELQVDFATLVASVAVFSVCNELDVQSSLSVTQCTPKGR